MANITTLPSKVDSCRETKIFAAITPDIFQAILDSIPAICRAVLNWEPLAISFLAEIIRQIPLSGELLYLGHLEFGRILFGEDSSEIAIRRRIGRAIKSVKRCQLLSGFKAVDIQSGEKMESGGKIEYFPTTYQLGDFFFVFLEFRDLAKEQDLMSLNQRQRKITQFAIAKSICDARGYVAILKRERGEKSQKEKSASLPSSKLEELRRQPNNFAVDLDWFMARYKQHLSETEPGRDFRIEVKRVWNAMEMAEREASDLIVQTKTGGKLHLVGGQPK